MDRALRSESSAKSFRVYYGHDAVEIDRLRDCDLLVFEPRGWTQEHLEALRAPGGPKLIGYLSAFAWPDWAGPTRWWWGPKERDETWQAWWYSMASRGWRYKVTGLAKDVLASCDGIFLDNLDRLQDDPFGLPFFLKWLQRIKEKWPTTYLLGNRGFANWDALCPHLNGVLFENLSDRAFGPDDKKWVTLQLERCRYEKIELFALDYDTRRDSEASQRYRSLESEMAYYCAPDENLQTLS